MAHDAHSSLTVVLPNAAQRMVKALATLWDDDLRPVVDGLDTGARPPTPEQLAIVDAQDTSALDDIREDWQIERLNAGLDGVDALRALTFDTTLNIQGLWSGHTETTAKTVTPAEARARIDIRIIPDQDPPAVVEALRRHLDAHGFADIEIVVSESEPAWWTPPSHPVVQAAAAVSADVAGMPASIGVSFPGTVPMHQVCARAPRPGDHARRGPRRLPGTRARREHPDRRPRRRHEDDGPLPRRVREPPRGAAGPLRGLPSGASAPRMPRAGRARPPCRSGRAPGGNGCPDGRTADPAQAVPPRPRRGSARRSRSARPP